MSKAEGTRDHALQLGLAAREKKAIDLLVLDLRGLANFVDFFVIGSGTSARQNRAIAAEIRRRADELGLVPLGLEESQDLSWILLDFGGIIVHIFLEETRAYYSLETLWADADRLELEEEAA
jgi:ribosome-associated protein